MLKRLQGVLQTDYASICKFAIFEAELPTHCAIWRGRTGLLFHLCTTDEDRRGAGQKMTGTGNGHFFEMPTIGDAEDITAILQASSWHFARALCHLN